MIYLFTAAYCEADIFIKKFDLKKVLTSTGFQHFYNEGTGLRLTVTGIGEIAAASAVSSICTEYKPKAEDFLLNAGICAGIRRREGIFLVNKLVEQATGKTFYPDLLYRHPFKEESLMTGMRPWTGCKNETDVSGVSQNETDASDISQNDTNAPDISQNETDASDISQNETDASGVSLFDMEAAAVYQAGIRFFGPHQMIFIKIISDCGEWNEDIRQHAGRLMAEYGDEMAGFIRQLMCMMQENSGFCRCMDTDAWINQVCADMHCSKSMEYSFKQHIRYLYLSGIDYAAVIQNMYVQGMLPCRNKREGKLCFEAFRKSLF